LAPGFKHLAATLLRSALAELIANCYLLIALFRWLHLQRIIKAVEIVEQPDRSQQLDNLAFIKVFAQLGKKLIVDGVRVAGNAFRQAQRGFLFFREVCTLFEVGQIVDLVVAPPVPSCQDGV
jgi:hypothetical protein